MVPVRRRIQVFILKINDDIIVSRHSDRLIQVSVHLVRLPADIRDSKNMQRRILV